MCGHVFSSTTLQNMLKLSPRISPLHGFGKEGKLCSFQDEFYFTPFGKTAGTSPSGFFPSLSLDTVSFPVPLAAILLGGLRRV